MMQQSINQSVANAGDLSTGLQGLYANNTLNAGLVGSTVGTGTLRFNAAGTFDPLLYAEQGTLAENGTSIAILQPGAYQVEAFVTQDDATNTFALAFGATVVNNVAAPTFATGGVLQLIAGASCPAGTVLPIPLSVTIMVRLPTARVTPSVTSANTVRILATAAAGGIVTNLIAASCSLRIVRANNFYS